MVSLLFIYLLREPLPSIKKGFSSSKWIWERGRRKPGSSPVTDELSIFQLCVSVPVGSEK